VNDARAARAACRHTRLLGDVGRRASWGFLDQVLSSASNFALSAFVAATISAAGFGAFTLVYAVYGVFLGLSGGFASIPLVVRFSAAAPTQFRAATRASAGAALAVGTAGGVLCLAVAPFTAPAIADPLRALGVMLPGLLVQDTWRYSFVTGGRPVRAAANDGLWIVLQLVGIAALLAADAVSALSMVLVWGGSATAAALLGCRQARVIPAPRLALGWLREQRALTFRYAAEALVHRSGWWLALGLVGAVAGLRVVGALRGAYLLLGGPLNLLFTGATFVFVAEGVRLLHRSPAKLPEATRGLSAAATVITLAWCILVLLLPGAIGSRLLGSTWPQAEPVLPVLTLLVLALAASMGPTQGMLALGAAKRSLFTQVAGLGVELPSMPAAAVVAGARGAALATGLTAVFRTVLAWVQFRRALRDSAASLRAETAEQALREAAAG
jgi:O-antigen/teichoic acid export membrane protein